MTKPLGQRLYEVKGALEAIEQELAAGSIPPEGLEDFKMVVDHIRLSVWATIAAERSQEYQERGAPETKQIIARFRLHRGEDICRAALSDIEAGVIPADSPELERFYSTLQQTTDQVAHVGRLSGDQVCLARCCVSGRQHL